MTNVDIDRIEVELGRALPQDYRALLANHTDMLMQAANTLRYFSVLWTDPDDIIRENLIARSHAHFMTIGEDEESEKPWPEDYLVVGTNGAGDFWFVDLSGVLKGLWFWQHEAHEITQKHANLDEYLAEVRGYLANPYSWPWQRG